MRLKQPSMPPNIEAELAQMDYEDLLNEVIESHTPTENKMVYMQLCTQLRIKPLASVYTKPKKGKEGLASMILKYRQEINAIWEE